jgi:VIT1/CCC1 family predicted Fe2+/Mn2+ transporter
MRASTHIEPEGLTAIARHYLRDLIYGANDGIITTYAVVAGVGGGALSPLVVLVVGAANLAADGLSMGVGNYLSIRANESAREAANLPEEEASPLRHALATFLAFVIAGAIPIAPYLLAWTSVNPQFSSAILTAGALFSLGAVRTVVGSGTWWKVGLEVLVLGAVVGAAAYGAGRITASLAGAR